MGQRGPWQGLGEIRAEMECLAPGTRKQLKQFLLACPGTHNGERPVDLVYYSVFGNLNSNKKNAFFTHAVKQR